MLWKNCVWNCVLLQPIIFSPTIASILIESSVISLFIFCLTYTCKHMKLLVMKTHCFLLISVVLFSSLEKGSAYLGKNVARNKTFSAILFQQCLFSIVSFIFCIFIIILPSQLYSLVWYVILFFCSSHKCQIWAKIYV